MVTPREGPLPAPRSALPARKTQRCTMDAQTATHSRIRSCREQDRWGSQCRPAELRQKGTGSRQRGPTTVAETHRSRGASCDSICCGIASSVILERVADPGDWLAGFENTITNLPATPARSHAAARPRMRGLLRRFGPGCQPARASEVATRSMKRSGTPRSATTATSMVAASRSVRARRRRACRGEPRRPRRRRTDWVVREDRSTLRDHERIVDDERAIEAVVSDRGTRSRTARVADERRIGFRGRTDDSDGLGGEARHLVDAPAGSARRRGARGERACSVTSRPIASGGRRPRRTAQAGHAFAAPVDVMFHSVVGVVWPGAR